MNDPDWAQILAQLYHENGEITEEGERNTDIEKPEYTAHEEALFDHLTTELNLKNQSYDAISETHKHLQNMGLIKFKTNKEKASMELKKKGFEVAHDREMNRNQQRTNIGIGVLTVFLVAGSLLQGYAAFLSQSGLFNQAILFAILIMSLSIGIIVVGIMVGESPREALNRIF